MARKRRREANGQAMVNGQLLRLEAVAARLDCPVREVQKLIRRGQLRKTTWNRTPRVMESDLLEFIAKLRRVRRPKPGRPGAPGDGQT